MATIAQKLIIRLKELGLEIPNEAIAKSLNRGYWNKKNGAWSWHVIDQDGHTLNWEIGSPDTMTECVKSRILNYYKPDYLQCYVVCAEEAEKRSQ